MDNNQNRRKRYARRNSCHDPREYQRISNLNNRFLNENNRRMFDMLMSRTDNGSNDGIYDANNNSLTQRSSSINNNQPTTTVSTIASSRSNYRGGMFMFAPPAEYGTRTIVVSMLPNSIVEFKVGSENGPYCSFIVATGTAASIFKIDKLKTKARIYRDERKRLVNYTDNPVQTLGSTRIELFFGVFSAAHKFNLIANNVKIPADGILGLDFLMKHKCKLDYENLSITLTLDHMFTT